MRNPEASVLHPQSQSATDCQHKGDISDFLAEILLPTRSVKTSMIGMDYCVGLYADR